MLRRVLHRLHDERGQASSEFLGWIGWVLLAGVAAWQLLLAGWTKIEATNAARTASRVIAKDGDPKRAGKAALPGGLRKGVKVDVSGDKVTVRVPLPVLIPSFVALEDLPLVGKAELPS
jgi:hypothetical protein